MKISTKIIIALIVLGIFDMVIPIPLLAIILLYVVVQRPEWFRYLVRDIFKEA